MTKKIMLIIMAILTAALMLTGCAGEEKKEATKTLKIGIDADFPPVVFKDVNGKDYLGFDIDLIKALAKEMGYKTEFSDMELNALMPALESGKVDVVICGLSITDERKQKVNFSAPYFKAGLTVLVDGKNTDIKEVKDLEGKRVAVQQGTTAVDFAKKIKGVVIKESVSSTDTFKELKAGTVDAVINDRPVNNYYMSGDKTVKVLAGALDNEEYGIAVAKKNDALLKEVNAALEKIKKSGEYDDIMRKWFGTTK